MPGSLPLLTRVLGLTAVALLAVALGTVVPTPAEQPSVTFPSTEQVEPTAPTATTVPAATAAPTDARTDAPPTPIALAGLRIRIERLGIDLPLAEGDIRRDVPSRAFEGETPEGVALVFPGSAPLATGGNTYVYAHARTGMFLSLWDVAAGDAVVISGPGVELHYVVRRVVPRVDPSDTSWLDPRGPERLTLQTSTGPRASDPRFIAVAEPIAGVRPGGRPEGRRPLT